MLGPVSSHTAAETRQVVATLESQPTVAGHSGDHPPDLETLRATPARPHQILIQGIMCESELGCERARGTMTAATVVLVHGMGGSPDAWSRVIPLLDSLGIPNVAVEL